LGFPLALLPDCKRIATRAKPVQMSHHGSSGTAKAPGFYKDTKGENLKTCRYMLIFLWLAGVKGNC
jgi:hypothetical protein